MRISDASHTRVQCLTNRYFARHASDWADIYHLQGVKDVVHQERLRIVLGLVSQLSLPAGTPVLDVGCGAGYFATELAKRGYDVSAIDPVPEMVDATRARAAQHGVGTKVRANSGDVHLLPFQDDTFRIVVAMGVLPWLPSIEPPLREMSRVLHPGGYLIVTTDNRWSLRWLLEPLNNPFTMPVKDVIQRVRQMFGHEPSCAPWYPSSRAALDDVLESKGLEQIAGLTAGFGPFTCLNRELLSPRAGVALHSRLQGLANRGAPILRSMGCHYIVMARKRRFPDDE